MRKILLVTCFIIMFPLYAYGEFYIGISGKHSLTTHHYLKSPYGYGLEMGLRYKKVMFRFELNNAIENRHYYGTHHIFALPPYDKITDYFDAYASYSSGEISLLYYPLDSKYIDFGMGMGIGLYDFDLEVIRESTNSRLYSGDGFKLGVGIRMNVGFKQLLPGNSILNFELKGVRTNEALSYKFDGPEPFRESIAVAEFRVSILYPLKVNRTNR